MVGWCRNNHGGVPSNFCNYFVITFDRDFREHHTWNENILNSNDLEEEGEHVGAILGFSTSKGEKVNMRVASSFISAEQALLNLESETGGMSFEDIKVRAKDIWNAELSRIKVEGGTDDQMRTFYSCLYRSLLFPRKFFEKNSKGDIVHYSPYNGKYCRVTCLLTMVLGYLQVAIPFPYPDVSGSEQPDNAGSGKYLPRKRMAS